MGKKRAFIVTDSFLYNNGYTKPITDKLDEMGIVHTTFFDVAPDPTLACAKEGAAQMRAFKPDCIIALGGGSAMDAGKIMWVLYEHPEADFMDMAMRFMDIRKRVYTFPKMGEKRTSSQSRRLRARAAKLPRLRLLPMKNGREISPCRLRTFAQNGNYRHGFPYERAARTYRRKRYRRRNSRSGSVRIDDGNRLHRRSCAQSVENHFRISAARLRQRTIRRACA